MFKKAVLIGVIAIGIQALWTWLMFLEIRDVIAAAANEQIVRTNFRTAMLALLTGLLGSGLAVLTSAQSGESRLGALPSVLGLKGDRVASVLAFIYAAVYVVGVLVGVAVAVSNESKASTTLVAVSTAGLGALATGVAVWMRLNLSPSVLGALSSPSLPATESASTSPTGAHSSVQEL